MGTVKQILHRNTASSTKMAIRKLSRTPNCFLAYNTGPVWPKSPLTPAFTEV